MSQKQISILIFLSVLLVALVIVVLALTDYSKTRASIEKPVKLPSKISAMAVSNPCQFPKCYYPQGQDFCHEHGKSIQITTPDLDSGNVCVQKESLLCNQGKWTYNKLPEKQCL